MCFILHQWIWIFAPISFCDCHIFRYFHLTQTQFNTKRIGKHNWLKFLFITINCTTFWYFFFFFLPFFWFFYFFVVVSSKIYCRNANSADLSHLLDATNREEKTTKRITNIVYANIQPFHRHTLTHIPTLNLQNTALHTNIHRAPHRCR